MRAIRNPDFGIIVANMLFTLGSCGLSAFCGYLLAAENGWLVQYVTAALFGCIAYALSKSVERAERYRMGGDRAGYRRAIALAILLVPANLLTDYSASSVLRDKTSVASQNANKVATNAQSEVTRLEGEIESLKSEKAWTRTDLEAPASYDALIFAAKQETENGRNIYQRSKQCTDTTVATSQALCQKIGSLEANKELALLRKDIKAAIDSKGEELKAAKQFAAANGKESNVALAPIKGLTSMWMSTLKPDASTVTWGLNYFVLVFTVTITGIIWLLSQEIGARRGPMVAAWIIDEADPSVSQQPYLQNYSKVPNHHVPASTWNHTEQTYVIPGGTVTGNAADQLRALRQKINETMREVTA